MKKGKLICWILGCMPLILAGCTFGPTNPSFPLDEDHAEFYLEEMAVHPKPLARPLVIVAGYWDPGLGSASLIHRLSKVINDRRMLGCVTTFARNFEQARRDLIAEVDRCYPGGNGNETTEVDVIGLSMGGLVARYATAPVDGQRRLKVRRLFTISSPYTGAKLADLPSFDRKVIDMRVNSKFMLRLAQLDHQASYELVPYVRLGDGIVGTQYACPPNGRIFWLPRRWYQMGHLFSEQDPRIVADIVRRLRNEQPFTIEPKGVLPDRLVQPN